MESIRDIFYSLDKLSDKWDPYFDVYEKHLSRFRGQAPKVLEIGVYKGGSLDMWSRYFGQGSKIIGIDIDPVVKQYRYAGDVEIILGDQGNVDFWEQFLQNYNDFDIIIDDGGHHMKQQMITLHSLFPALKEDGVYICEDTHTSYWTDWGGRHNDPNTFLSLAKKLTDYLNKEHIPQKLFDNYTKIYQDKLNSITFYNSAVVLEKKTSKPFKRVYSNEQLREN